MSADCPVIVVLPDDTRILESDLCGRPVRDYLLERLSECGCAAARVCGVAELESAQRAGEGVLILDARAWLSSAALASLLERVRGATGSFRVVESAARANATIAVYFAAGADPSPLGLAALPDATVVAASQLDPASEGRLVASYEDLAGLERRLLLERAAAVMKQGVRVRDPHTLYIRGELVCGSDVEIDVNVVIEGAVVLGNGARIGANSVLRNVRVGERTRINAFSLVEESSIGSDCFVGPYGRVRSGCVIGDAVQIGNYVEIKSSQVGSGSRVNHLAFIGDAVLADQVTIGAGTITCNHDGIGTNQTILEHGAYVGSNCSLVAPVRIGAGAIVGAGSTITRDVPPAKLTLARSPQTTVENWRGPKGRRQKE